MRSLRDLTFELTVDGAGVPQSASVTYKVIDGGAFKYATYEVPTPDFSKVMHSTGAPGEFWRDAVDAIKALEGAS